MVKKETDNKHSTNTIGKMCTLWKIILNVSEKKFL